MFWIWCWKTMVIQYEIYWNILDNYSMIHVNGITNVQYIPVHSGSFLKTPMHSDRTFHRNSFTAVELCRNLHPVGFAFVEVLGVELWPHPRIYPPLSPPLIYSIFKRCKRTTTDVVYNRCQTRSYKQATYILWSHNVIYIIYILDTYIHVITLSLRWSVFWMFQRLRPLRTPVERTAFARELFTPVISLDLSGDLG